MDQTESADLAIIADYLSKPGDERAEQTFFAQFGPLFRIWIRRELNNASREDQEDVYQTVLLKVVSGQLLGGYNPELGKPRAFLRKAVANCAIDFLRKRSKELPLDREEGLVNQLSMLADSFPPRSEEELRGQIAAYLAQQEIPEKKLRAYKAFLNGLTVEDVMKQLNISQSTAYRYRLAILTEVRSLFNLPEKKSSNE